jgi:UDP-glucuronate decarboxylase
LIENNPVIIEDLNRIAESDLPWHDLKDKAILVTGGGGFIGSYLVKSLLNASSQKDLGLIVYALGRSSLKSYSRLADCSNDSAFHFIQHDLSSNSCVSLPKLDIIIHAASQASPRFYGIDPVGTLLPNIKGTYALLDYVRYHGGCKFLFLSSGSVYGDHKGIIDEFGEQDYGWLDPVNVRSCYAESKRMGETMCASWSHQYGVDARIIRPFHTYGPSISLDDGRVFSDFIADAVHRRGIIIKSDGAATRSFCYISDVIQGILAILFYGNTCEAYNIGNPKESISVSALAQLIKDLFPERIPFVEYDTKHRGNEYIPSPVKSTSPSIVKANHLGWTPHVGLREGFHRSILSFSLLPDCS